ncbi:N-acylneuraminate cytidylyltransferase [Clostridium facile]|uniref:N-acylneuraminate cytidylyltransferase n=1 Tax=Clostridium facile TaxID=2763035 RepID=A0ABR7IPB1_9CLOT|nr:N-acylneuraminate cytidylyltransferase [Clostridium facile]MBC5786975.1 N-acylneuraminate cytidylyltransferase [Clostridium facile]
MNIALIPVRGGSKSIPMKNIKPICGKPLVYWTAKAACQCPQIDRVYISTESQEIKQVVEQFQAKEPQLFSKLEVVGRSEETATDTASTESVMLEFAQQHEFENIALVQATSPLLSSQDLTNGFQALQTDGTDSIVSVVRQKRFQWKVNNGFALPTNYDVFQRPRRQEFEGYLVENGAFYICSREDLLRTQNRVSGKIKAVEMDEDSFFEVDEPRDWAIVEALMRKNNPVLIRRPSNIRMFLTDCDGCLTDGGMYYSERGDELKKFNTRDGMGFGMLREKGIITGIITSEEVELNQRRADKLRLDFLESGCKDKLAAIQKRCEKYGISLEQVVYVGDDINDLEAIQTVGYGCCPSDAMPCVQQAADYIASAKGGQGVIREIVEQLLEEP